MLSKVKILKNIKRHRRKGIYKFVNFSCQSIPSMEGDDDSDGNGFLERVRGPGSSWSGSMLILSINIIFFLKQCRTKQRIVCL